jgi:hypothetical protein
VEPIAWTLFLPPEVSEGPESVASLPRCVRIRARMQVTVVRSVRVARAPLVMIP